MRAFLIGKWFAHAGNARTKAIRTREQSAYADYAHMLAFLIGAQFEVVMPRTYWSGRKASQENYLR